MKDAVTAMGALSFLFALANLVLVAVKLSKPKHGTNCDAKIVPCLRGPVRIRTILAPSFWRCFQTQLAVQTCRQQGARKRHTT